MEIHNEGLELLRKGIVLPHFRILSFFLEDILRDSFRVLDINSHGGYLREVIDIMYPRLIDYVGVDSNFEDVKKARDNKIPGVFRHIDYDKMRLRSDSYDLIIAQDQFLYGEDFVDRVDNLFRASKKWVVLFNFLVLPECDSFMDFEIDGETKRIFGINHLRELFSIMEPSQLSYSLIVKNDNPIKPTPSIFVIKI